MKEENRPQFLIIGAQKCGTTTLYHTLTQHPNILRAVTKEIHFFNKQYRKGIDWYFQQFPSKIDKNQITGEATPEYIWDSKCRMRIRRHLPNVKLIAIFRDPVERAYSHYNYCLRRGVITNMSFEEALKKDFRGMLTRGLYVKQLNEWFSLFPREQILILDSASYFFDPNKTISEICDFLEIPQWKVNSNEPFNQNKYEKEINPKTEEWLTSYYRPFNEELYALLDRQFDWKK